MAYVARGEIITSIGGGRRGESQLVCGPIYITLDPHRLVHSNFDIIVVGLNYTTFSGRLGRAIFIEIELNKYTIHNSKYITHGSFYYLGLTKQTVEKPKLSKAWD